VDLLENAIASRTMERPAKINVEEWVMEVGA
jgi:hypothetical protein